MSLNRWISLALSKKEEEGEVDAKMKLEKDKKIKVMIHPIIQEFFHSFL